MLVQQYCNPFTNQISSASLAELEQKLSSLPIPQSSIRIIFEDWSGFQYVDLARSTASNFRLFATWRRELDKYRKVARPPIEEVVSDDPVEEGMVRCSFYRCDGSPFSMGIPKEHWDDPELRRVFYTSQGITPSQVYVQHSKEEAL